MKKILIIFSLSFIVAFSSCTKGPGTGGRASIKGKIYARNYNNSYAVIDSGFIGGQKVFIKYGDEMGVGNDVDTDNTGTFVFPYLRKGNYTVYVFSKKLLNNTLDSAIVKTVTISERKQVLDLGQMDINTFKN
jgi:hypothetical protein